MGSCDFFIIIFFFKCWVTGQCGIVVGGVMSAVEEFVKSPS